jgi:phosphoribosylanthranilate isomerase
MACRCRQDLNFSKVMKPKLKLCGFNDIEIIKFCSKLDIDFMGFVFYEKSCRNIDFNLAQKACKILPEKIQKVAVIVDKTNDEIAEIIDNLNPQLIQLHGSEDIERCKEIKKNFSLPIIKAFKIKDNIDLDEVKNFEDIVDYFLFDSKSTQEIGGSGKKFDWNILKNLKTRKDWFLSGGININNIDSAIKQSGAKMIDLSSGIEEVKGQKSKKLISNLLTKFKNYGKVS